MLRIFLSALVLGLVLMNGQAISADDKVKAMARQLLTKHKDSIVRIRVVLSSRQGTEYRMEVNGTVLSPDGLILLSDYSIRPDIRESVTIAPSKPLPQPKESGSGPAPKELGPLYTSPGPTLGPPVQTHIKNATVVFEDGREIATECILRDIDLDIALLVPKRKERDLPYLKLEKGPTPENLDDLIFIYRLTKSLERKAAASLGLVSTVVQKPRPFIVTDFGGCSAGCPVFDCQGRLLGFSLILREPGGKASPDDDSPLQIAPQVVLPAEVVQAAIARALERRKK